MKLNFCLKILTPYNIRKKSIFLGDSNSKKLKNPITTLSPREMLVMQLLTEGNWAKEITSILKVKENTISTYKRRILDVTDEIELSKKVSLLKNF